jgi:fatty-acyl-CoA synthase
MDWNFGDMLDAVGAALGPDDLALAHGERRIYWPGFTARTNRLARALLAHGIARGDKAGFYMRNQPEYMEAMAACFKASLSPVNVNYRYLDDELVYIIDNSDSTVVFFDSEFLAEVERVRARLPRVTAWVQIGGETVAPFALCYETLATEGDPSPIKGERSGDDIFLLYTGGTTGLPKGVMWTHDIWREASMEGVRKLGGPVPATMEEHVQNAVTVGRFSRQVPACPLMHGTGWFTAMGAMLNGGAVVTLSEKTRFSPENLWDTVHQNGVTSMAIVGDAFAKPMLKTLDENPGRWNLSSVLAIISSGVMWSSEVKQGLLKHMPQVTLNDSFGASEAVGFGSSVTTADGGTQTSKFEIGPSCKVFTEDDREVLPGSTEPGFIARGGAVPLGYYKDPEKTAKTYKTIGGVRYAIPGDWCTVEKDGTITLLGRGSNCINTAGEKVYPEEVEEALKSHGAVSDALVVGVPDDKWGQAVTAVVSVSKDVSEDELRAYIQTKLARYKAPKRILFKDNLGRAPNGKADYKSIKAFALDELGIPG